MMKNYLMLLLMAFSFGLSNATVVTFIPNTYYFDWQVPYLYVDVNNDGFNDFLMTAEASLGANTSWFKIKSLTAGTKILTDGTGKVNGLNDSVLISSSIPANLWADSAWVYRWDGNPYPFPVNSVSHMAFRFSDGTNDHYGYIWGRCFGTYPGQGFEDYTIYRIGYEDTPNAAIKAGALTSIVAVTEASLPAFTMSQLKDLIRLDFDRPIDALVEVCDLQGRLLMTRDFQGAVCDLATQEMCQGVYLVQVTSRKTQGGARMTRKFVLTKD